MRIGADYRADRSCSFVVWAPGKRDVRLKIVSPEERLISMQQDSNGYWKAEVLDLAPQTPYLYLLDGIIVRPDPASQFQPDGVHGPSVAVDHLTFDWCDEDWQGLDLAELIIYEIHVGTFTNQGTFDAIIPRIGQLKDIGVNAIEIMPAAQFPGDRNWGYDGAYPFAVQNSYGGPEALKRLVRECHKAQVAVILDVVYNHLGPEGNYLRDYGPYFTGKYHTPWGEALNFDDAFSDGVRNYFIENALHWFRLYHIDALRLDAVHAIYDMSAVPFLQELAEKTRAYSEEVGRPFLLIAESDRNDTRIIATRPLGCGLDALWCDDFHHALHTLLTSENDGYYADFGESRHLVKSLREGFVYSGEYSHFRKRRHGASSKDYAGSRFVVFSQNHDQIGNRMLGERLSQLVGFEALKLCAGMVLLAPYVPLLFMGEEYGEEAPFLYFVSHSDPDLIEGVRQGRRKEFEAFRWRGEAPDPQDMDTFLRSRLSWEKRGEGAHRVLLEFYKSLIGLRKETPALVEPDKERLNVLCLEDQGIILMERWDRNDSCRVLCLFNFNREDAGIALDEFAYKGMWRKRLDSSESRWNGPGSLLPDSIGCGEEIFLRGHGLSVYLREGV
ncbi:MAG: malto-oligosyltrehalose trehalohydrolase [Syntrophobacteraceae bacterium]